MLRPTTTLARVSTGPLRHAFLIGALTNAIHGYPLKRPGAEEGSIAHEHRDAEKPPGGRRLLVFRLYLLGAICHYIFTVKGLASLKLSVDSAGRTISLFPV